MGTVTLVERIGDLVEIAVSLPGLASTVLPGQFAQLQCSSTIVPLLRRPFSIAWVEGDLCSFVFDEVGVGTRLLGALKPGDVLDVIGPLGRGFSLDSLGGPVICVSGGVGCAPFPILIKALASRGVQDITVFNGAASVRRLYPAARFRRDHAQVRVVEATDDGSRGHRGFVTELLGADELRRAGAVFACGPNVMLATLARLVANKSAHEAVLLEASLEAPMGCGFGTCLGCALPVRRANTEMAWALCCTDGPVMSMRDLDWQELAAMPAPDAA